MKQWKKKKKKKKKKTKKNGEKWWKKERKMKKNWLHTQNPRRFPVFTVVVVTLFVKILDDFHDFVSECVSFPKEKWQFSLDVKQKYTFFQRKSTKKNR